MRIKAFISWCAVLVLLSGAFIAPSNSLARPLSGTISGTTSYAGSHDTNHEVLVAAHPGLDSDPVASVHTWGLAAYALENLPDGSYYISAFLDIHDRSGGPPEFGEPYGWYDANADGNPDPVTVNGGNLSGIDIIMHDVDSEYIQGTVCYLGGVTGLGPMQVALHTDPAAPPVVSQDVSLPCDEYIFNGGPAGTYYVSLFYDVNASSGPPEPGEPFGWYDANNDGNPDPVIYTGEVITDINITLGGIYYVDFSAMGNADGNSWEDAFPDLQAALTAAQPGEEIWVAAGIYTPGTNRDASFVLPHGVAVYGGFSGSENIRGQRNWRANLTVLSGEIGDPGSKTDNAYHVVTTASTYGNPVDETTILDGFTIMGGYADVDANQTEKGGGFLSSYGSPTLVNLNFVDNYAFNHGGALAVQYNHDPLLVANCTFSGNSATNNAGGIANLSKVTVINSSFVGNLGGNGGGIVNLDGSHAEIHNSILWGNPGGQIALQGTAAVTVTYSLVEGGFASGSHVLTDDPLFVDANGPDNIFGTLDDDLHLQVGSPAIDAGDNTRLPVDVADSNGNGDIAEVIPLDLDGDSRFLDDPGTPDSGNGAAPIVDLGADELAAPVSIHGLGIAATPAPNLLGETVWFAARVLRGTQVTYAWDFGDSILGDGPLPVHSYAAPGVYTVALTATNHLGDQHAHTVITVSEVLDFNPGSSQTTSDGALEISIPAALTSTVTLTYTPQTAPTSTPGGFDFAGLAFELRAADGDGNPIREPGEAFTLTIHYDENILPSGTDESTLELHRYDEVSGIWLALAVIGRDPSHNTLTVLLDHFSEYALWVEAAQTERQICLPLVVR